MFGSESLKENVREKNREKKYKKWKSEENKK